MEYEVYCDEAYPDVFSSALTDCTFLVIGSLWMEKKNRDAYKNKIHELRDQYKIGPEFKWRKINKSKIDFYKSLIDFFVSENLDLRFRAIVIDKTKVDLIHYHQSDQELGFYKFYYQLLHHWILDFNRYQIFCDYKKNRLRDRLKVLKECLNCSNLASEIASVQAVRSKESVLIQLTDFFTGMVGAKYNRDDLGNAKSDMINYFEEKSGKEISKTRRFENKFNIFEINLSGGW